MLPSMTKGGIDEQGFQGVVIDDNTLMKKVEVMTWKTWQEKDVKDKALAKWHGKGKMLDDDMVSKLDKDDGKQRKNIWQRQNHNMALDKDLAWHLCFGTLGNSHGASKGLAPTHFVAWWHLDTSRSLLMNLVGWEFKYQSKKNYTCIYTNRLDK